MSALDTMTFFAYGWALMGASFSKRDTGKVKWMLWAIIILLSHIAGKLTP